MDRNISICRKFIAVLLCAVIAANGAGLSFAAAPVPPDKPGHFPDWWFTREVIKRLDPLNDSPQWLANDYPQSDDYHVLNHGQLKNLAQAALLEMEEKLPGLSGGEVFELVADFHSEYDLSLRSGVSASQITTFHDAVAERAIDGNEDGEYWNGSVSHTELSSDPWWQVNLGTVRTINSVEVWSRTGSDRLKDFYVFVSPADMSGRTLGSLLSDTSVWKSAKITAVPNPSTTIEVPAFAGRYVMVRIQGTQYLELAEVSVQGRSFTDNYAAANLGQLKNVARPFYDRMKEIGYLTSYPWEGSATPADDYALANLGQAKSLFRLDISGFAAFVDQDANENNLPDWWEKMVAKTNGGISYEDFGEPTYNSAPADEGLSQGGMANAVNSILSDEELFQKSMIGRDSPPPPSLHAIYGPSLFRWTENGWQDQWSYRDRTGCRVTFYYPDAYRQHIHGFQVYRKVISLDPSDDGKWDPLGERLAPDATEFDDIGLRGDKRYYYRISAVSRFGESAPSVPFGYSPPADPWVIYSKSRAAGTYIESAYSDSWSGTHNWYMEEWLEEGGLDFVEKGSRSVGGSGRNPNALVPTVIADVPAFPDDKMIEDLSEIRDFSQISGFLLREGTTWTSPTLGAAKAVMDYGYSYDANPLFGSSIRVDAVQYAIQTCPGTAIKWSEVLAWDRDWYDFEVDDELGWHLADEGHTEGARLLNRRVIPGNFDIKPSSGDFAEAGGPNQGDEGDIYFVYGIVSDVDLFLSPEETSNGIEINEWPDALEDDPATIPAVRHGEPLRVHVRYYSNMADWSKAPELYTILDWESAHFDVRDESFTPSFPLVPGDPVVDGAVLTVYPKSAAPVGTVLTLAATGSWRGIELGEDVVKFKVAAPVVEFNEAEDYRFPFDEATGARYRKIGLNGRPMSDSKPQSRPESDDSAEETFIDALTLGLRHSTTDVYIPVPGADFAAEAKRTIVSEIWTTRRGLRPFERPDRPFGAGWTSNLAACIEHVQTSSLDDLDDVFVTAHTGARYHFRGNQYSEWLPVASGRHEQWMYAVSLENEVRNNREVWVFRAGKGTEIIFEGIEVNVDGQNMNVPAVERIVSDDRERGSHASTTHHFYRVHSVVDRFGNFLRYGFGGNPSLIPMYISSGVIGQQGGAGKISISQNAEGRITDIWDANGNRWKYEYGTRIYTSPLTPNWSYKETVLAKVIAPDNSETGFGYDFVREDDLYTPRSDWDVPTPNWHLNLNHIKNPDDRSYSFTYEWDHTKKSFDTGAGYFIQTGRPRWIKLSQLPEGSAEFWNSPPEQPNWDVRLGYNTASKQFQNATSPARYAKAKDCEGNFSVYQWSDTLALGLSNVASGKLVIWETPLVLCYQTMSITYAGVGSESFKFDVAAGLSLSETTDLSGNVTSFYYDDDVPRTPLPVGDAVEPRAEEPTREISAIQGTIDPVTHAVREGLREFVYTELDIRGQDCRFLWKVLEEDGRSIIYNVDGANGRTLSETRTGPQGGTLETTYLYEDPDFPGVVTQKEVKRSGGDTSIPSSIVTRFLLGPRGNVITETINPGGLNLETTHTYDANGNRRSTTDPRGYLTGFSYDSRNRLTKIEYPGKFTKEFEYDGRGNKVKETDENGNVTTYRYDGQSRLLSANRGGAVTSYGYNKVGSRTSVTDPNGNVTETKYDPLQRPIETKDALGRKTFYVYGVNSGGQATDATGFKPTKITDARGTVTDFGYDALYRQISKTVAYKPGKTAVWLTDYDAVGNPVKEIEPGRGEMPGIVTWREYDGPSRLTKVRFADDSEEEIIYNSVGLQWKVLSKRTQNDPAPLETMTTFDGAGRPVIVTSPSVPDENDVPVRPVVQTWYDDAGNVISVIDPRGKVTTFVYDARNRKVKDVHPAVPNGPNGPVETPTVCYVYDGVGNVIATRDARGAVTLSGYDQWNRVTLTQRPGNGGRIFTGYDKVGNIVRVTDGNGHSTRNTYDLLNRLSSTTDPMGISVSYRYDAVGNRTRVTDGKGQQTSFKYDGLGRNTETRHPSSPPIVFEYDGVNKVKRIDAALRITDYTYDLRNRLETVTYGGGNQAHRTYTYDKFGNILGVVEPDKGGKADVGYTYDALRRVLTETSGGVTHTYKYDLSGNRTRAIYGGTGRTLDSKYDALNRLSEVTEGGRVTAYAYDLNGNVVEKTLPNADKVTTGYDVLNRAVSIIGRSAPTVAEPEGLLHYGYEQDFDPVGNLIGCVETYGGGIQPRELTLWYDRADRLTDEAVLEGGVSRVTSYAYDAANNRSTKTIVTDGAAPVVTSYGYNDRNQLLSVSGAPGASYQYDENGNRKTRTRGLQVDTYAYDYENRLVRYDGESTQAGADSFTYTYDYRTRRVEIAPGGGTPTTLVFSGGTSVQEIESGAMAVEYVRGSDRGGGAGSILYTLRQGTPSYTHYDGRGDVTAKTDGTGAITYQASYEAFGKRTQETGSTNDRQKANTKEEDPTGLLNEGFRYRDLETGTFLTRDPAGFVDGPNLYAYVRQNPWTYFDPEGLYLDLAIEVVSISVGLGSSVDNFRQGNVGSGFADLGFAALDVVLAIVPGVPGGSGLVRQGIKQGAKHGDEAIDTGRAVEKTAGSAPAKPIPSEGPTRPVADTPPTPSAASTQAKAAEEAAKGGDSYVYGVIDTHTGTLAKPGMSSGPIPGRMNQSVKAADQRSGVPGQHKGVIIKKKLTPEQARANEQKLTDKVEVRRPGTFPNKFHQRPKPKVRTKEQFKERYGHEHNR